MLHMHTHTTHTHTHTHTQHTHNTHTHTHTYAHTHTHTHMHIHARTHARKHTHIHVHSRFNGCLVSYYFDVQALSAKDRKAMAAGKELLASVLIPVLPDLIAKVCSSLYVHLVSNKYMTVLIVWY